MRIVKYDPNSDSAGDWACHNYTNKDDEIISAEISARYARGVNDSIFNDHNVVSGYVHATDSRYHTIRREQAAKLLGTALLLPGSPDGPILEIGSGGEDILSSTGSFGRALIHNDRHHAPLAQGLARGAIKQGVQFNIGEAWPLRSDSLAAVIGGECLEHFGADLYQAMYEVNRTVKRLGAVVFTVPNLAALQDRWKFSLGEVPREYSGDVASKQDAHFSYFTPHFMSEFLETFGFEPLDIRSNLVGWQLKSGKWLESRLLARIFPKLGGSIIVSARKVGPPNLPDFITAYLDQRSSVPNYDHNGTNLPPSKLWVRRREWPL